MTEWFNQYTLDELSNQVLHGAAGARGGLGGRPKAKTLNTPKKVAMAQALYDDKINTIDEICKTLNISRSRLYHYINTANTLETRH
jgi:DNA invertase Pin-like site-specific DNA recombinase